MRKYIALVLVTAMPLSLAGAGGGVLGALDPKSWKVPTPTSIHDVNTLKGAAQGVLVGLQLHGKTPMTAAGKCSICCSDLTDGKCQDQSHSKKAAAFLGSQFVEGLFFGAQNYLILNHLYNQGPVAAGTQLGVNFLSAQAVNQLVEWSKPHLSLPENQAVSLVRHLGTSVVKRLTKLGLVNVGLKGDIVFEARKKRSFFKGTLMNTTSNISSSAITKLNTKFVNPEYEKAREWKRYEHPTLAVKGLGAMLGAYLARVLLEENLDKLVEFLSHQVKANAPDMLKTLVSLTK